MAGGGAGAGMLGNVTRTLHYNTFNPAEHNVLVLSDADGGTYELMCVIAGSGSGSVRYKMGS